VRAEGRAAGSALDAQVGGGSDQHMTRAYVAYSAQPQCLRQPISATGESAQWRPHLPSPQVTVISLFTGAPKAAKARISTDAPGGTLAGKLGAKSARAPPTDSGSISTPITQTLASVNPGYGPGCVRRRDFVEVVALLIAGLSGTVWRSAGARAVLTATSTRPSS
jgi:hypothetical protein